MIYASKKALDNAKRKAWKMPKPYHEASESDGKRSLETSPEGNYVPEINGGLGISAKRFPNIKGADLFY